MKRKTIKKKDFTDKLYKNLGFSKIISENLINDIFEILFAHLEENKSVKIASFGTFKASQKKERIGRNPKTKEPARISARRVVTFKASQVFKNKLKNKS